MRTGYERTNGIVFSQPGAEKGITRFHDVNVTVTSPHLKEADRCHVITVPDAFPVPGSMQLSRQRLLASHNRQVVRNPDFIKMCVLYPHLAQDREAALTYLEKFCRVSREEESLLQTKDHAKATRAYFVLQSQHHLWEQWVQLSPFVSCQFVPGLKGLRKNAEPYVLIRCGDVLCRESFFLRPKLNNKDTKALWRFNLTLAYFGQTLPA